MEQSPPIFLSNEQINTINCPSTSFELNDIDDAVSSWVKKQEIIPSPLKESTFSTTFR